MRALVGYYSTSQYDGGILQTNVYVTEYDLVPQTPTRECTTTFTNYLK